MFLLDWYKQWLEIRAAARLKGTEVKKEETVCQSCETLRQQLEISNYEKERLLNRLLEKPEKVPERTEAPPLVAQRPQVVPWRVRQQMLEREDREKARALANAAKPDSKTEAEETAAFEKELDDATKRREETATNAGGTK